MTYCSTASILADADRFSADLQGLTQLLDQSRPDLHRHARTLCLGFQSLRDGVANGLESRDRLLAAPDAVEQQIEALEQQIEELKAQVAAMVGELDALRKRVNALDGRDDPHVVRH